MKIEYPLIIDSNFDKSYRVINFLPDLDNKIIETMDQRVIKANRNAHQLNIEPILLNKILIDVYSPIKTSVDNIKDFRRWGFEDDRDRGYSRLRYELYEPLKNLK